MDLVPVFLGDPVTMCACHAHVCRFLCVRHWYACLTLVLTWESGGWHTPVFEAPDDLLEEDDSVRDGLVPLHLQQHVMVVLQGRAPER